MSALQLHSRAMAVAKEIKTKYLELFEILLEVERSRLYLSFDVISLHLYCTEMLELSPHVANDFIQVVRKSLEVPALTERVREKKVTISKARKICPVLTNDNAKEWLDLAQECSCRVIEKAVASVRPREAVHESMKYVAEDTLEFKLAVDEEWEALLNETKDLMSQQASCAVSSEEALRDLMKKFCQKENPVRKAERASASSTTCARGTTRAGRTTLARRTTSGASGRRTRYRPAYVEHKVNLRDQNRCAHIHANGKRCEQTRWLEKHHLKTFAEGGDHTSENLVTLCWAHHKIRHMQIELVT